jgi:hypothetical protein
MQGGTSKNPKKGSPGGWTDVMAFNTTLFFILVRETCDARRYQQYKDR